MKAIKRLVIDKKIVLAHALITLALISSSTYSVYSVVNDFVNDNVMTTVLVNSSRDVLPYLKHLTLYMQFRDSAVFPETWTPIKDAAYKILFDTDMYNDVNDSARPSNYLPRLANRTDEASFYISKNRQLPLDSLIDIAAINSIIREVDDLFIRYGDTIGKDQQVQNERQLYTIEASQLRLDCGQGANCSLAFLSIDNTFQPLIMPVVDRFMEKKYGEVLVAEALSHIINYDYFPNSSGQTFASVPVEFTVDNLSHNSLQITIPLDFVVNKTWNDIYVRVLPAGYKTSTGIASPPALDYVSILAGRFPKTPNSDFPFGWPLRESKSLHSRVEVLNTGIYETANVRSEEDCGKCAYTGVALCMFKCKLELIGSVCGCIPFTYRRLYASDSRKRLPRCTTERYVTCFQKGQYDSSLQCTEKNCNPCTLIDNLVTIISNEHPANFASSTFKEPIYKIIIQILCSKDAYVTFQNKYQNSWMQMLAQIGGNLGLFLSFSLLGVWQFVIFVLKYVVKRRRSKKSSKDEGPNILLTWLRTTQVTKVDANNCPANDCKEAREKSATEIQALRLLIEQLDRKCETTTIENDKLKNAFEDMRTNILKLKNSSNELHANGTKRSKNDSLDATTHDGRTDKVALNGKNGTHRVYIH